MTLASSLEKKSAFLPNRHCHGLARSVNVSPQQMKLVAVIDTLIDETEPVSKVHVIGNRSSLKPNTGWMK